MDRITELLNTYIEPIMERVDENPIMNALKAGSIATMPFLLFGGMAMIVLEFPGIQIYAPALHSWLNTNFSPIVDCTFGFTGLILLIGIAVAYAKELEIHSVHAAITSLLCFMIVTPFQATSEVSLEGASQIFTMQDVIPLQVFGFRSMITAIIVSLLAVRIFAFTARRNQMFALPDSVPPMVLEAFTSIIPASVAMLLFLGIRILLGLTPYLSLTDCIYAIVITPLLGIGNHIVSFLGVTQLFANFLWFFGIHGTNVVMAVWGPVLQTMGVANLEAFRAGAPLPYITSEAFRAVYGITNVYVIAITMLLAMKSKRLRKVAKMSVIPAVFCVSEPMMFGLPIFMNPILLFPFLVCSSVQFGLAYLLCRVGIAPVPVIPTPWTTPIFINALIATNWNFMGVITQLLLLAVGIPIWYPFMKMMDRRFLLQEQEAESKPSIDLI